MSKYEVYHRALMNEYALSERYRETVIGYRLKATLPNPAKLQRIPRGLQDRLEKAVEAVVNTWWILAYPAFIVLGALRALMWYLSAERLDAKNVVKGRVGAVLTHRLPALISRLDDSAKIDIYLTFPWVTLETEDIVTTPFVSVSSMISLTDIIGAVADCIGLSRYLKNNVGDKGKRPFTYSAYRWFLMWRVLSRGLKGASEILIANHYDRWAVLVDELPLNTIKRSVLQHGLIEHQPVPERLRNIDVLYCYDESQKQQFMKVVLDCTPEVRYLPATIETEELPGKYKQYFTVLVVGQPVDPEGEVDVAQEIEKIFPEVWVLIKPHPVYPKEPYDDVSGDRITVITDDRWYPSVDLVVYSRSTLGYEYKASGVNTIRSPDLEIDEILPAIARVLGTEEGLRKRGK